MNIDINQREYDKFTNQNEVKVTNSFSLPTSGNNPSLTIAYDSNDQPITITKTISGTSYTKTLTWVGGVCIAVSVWSAV